VRRAPALLAALLWGTSALAQVPVPEPEPERAAGTSEAAEAWNRQREAWDPAADGMTTLAALAAAATGMGDLPRFHAFLDTLVRQDRAGPNALRYWGAVGLQLGVPPDTVAARFAASLDAGTEAVTVAQLVQVLQAYEAEGAALVLLDRADAAGVPRGRLALVRGQLLARADDRGGAVDAWLLALAGGEDEALTAAARIEDLVADGRGVPAGTIERLEAARSVASGKVAETLSRLLARVHAAEGRWAEALAIADDPVLGPVARGEVVRAIAATARAAGRLEAAVEALGALVALGPPAARPEDRLALGEVQEALGDEAGAAASFEAARRAGVAGARGRELAATVEAARASGDPERIARVVAEAEEAGADPVRLAVPRGDLHLARASPDSAMSAYAEGVGEGQVGGSGLEALARLRLAQALVRSGTAPATVAEIGAALVAAPADPAAAWRRFEDLAGRTGKADSLGIARSLVQGLAGEWRGRSGEAAAASAGLERAAGDASPGEAPALLLAAGRWAHAAGDLERARRLWRAVVEEHGATPYGLDARRWLAEAGP